MADALSQYPCKGEDTEVDIPVVVAARPVNHPLFLQIRTGMVPLVGGTGKILVIAYLKNGVLPEDSQHACHLAASKSSYALVDNILLSHCP